MTNQSERAQAFEAAGEADGTSRRGERTMLMEKRKQQIQDWLVAIGIALFIVVVATALVLVVGRTYDCYC
jgi:hypothetical protein